MVSPAPTSAAMPVGQLKARPSHGMISVQSWRGSALFLLGRVVSLYEMHGRYEILKKTVSKAPSSRLCMCNWTPLCMEEQCMERCCRPCTKVRTRLAPCRARIHDLTTCEASTPITAPQLYRETSYVAMILDCEDILNLNHVSHSQFIATMFALFR